uniref:Cadherin domain-containing protein n=1 Tax=Oryzias melastigma TaxID=30732 RepID=A0A3B3C7W1_ORYME
MELPLCWVWILLTVNMPPQFQLPNYQVSVPENEPAGTRVITLKATDPDDGEAGRLVYSMEALFDKRSSDFFEIDPQTGSITTIQALDREVKDTHVFKVLVIDNGTPQRSAASYLTVTVSDTNDHVPVFEQNNYRVSIRENVEVAFLHFCPPSLPPPSNNLSTPRLSIC